MKKIATPSELPLIKIFERQAENFLKKVFLRLVIVFMLAS
jgi:hypothetical protein